MSRYKRKTNNGIKDFSGLLEAIKEIKINKKSVTTTARAFNIPKSSLTRYVVKFDARIDDILSVNDDTLMKIVKQIALISTDQQIFPAEMEEALADYIRNFPEHESKLSIKDLRMIAYQFAKEMHINYPLSWDRHEMAGTHWCYSFAQRYSYLNIGVSSKQRLSAAKKKFNLSTAQMDSYDCQNSTNFYGLLQAIKEIEINKKSIRATARSFGIPETTLSLYVNELKDKVIDFLFIDDDELLLIIKQIAAMIAETQVFSSQEEEALVDYIKNCRIENNELSITDLRMMVYRFARDMYIDYPSNWDRDEKASEQWYISFLKRHSYLHLKTTTQPELVQIKQEIDTEDVISDEETQVKPLASLNPSSTSSTNAPIQAIGANKTEFYGILQAIKEVKMYNKTISNVAGKYNISEANLLHYITQFDAEISEILFLNDEDLLDVVKRIVSLPMETQHSDAKDVVDQKLKNTVPIPSSFHASNSSNDYLMIHKKGVLSCTTLREAIKDVKMNKKSLRATSRKFNIPKTSLSRYIAKFDLEISDIFTLNDDELLRVIKELIEFSKSPQIFSETEEEVLVDFLKDSINSNGKPNINEFRRYVYQFARNMQIDYPWLWDRDQIAGRHWYYSFAQRHSYLNLNTSVKACSSKIKKKREHRGNMRTSTPIVYGKESVFENSVKKPMSVETPCSSFKKRKFNENITENSNKSVPPAKRKLLKSATLSKTEAFCIICIKRLPRKLTATNSVIHSEYNTSVHMRCSKKENFLLK